MKITITTMMLSEDIELPDDENNFYRQLAKKMASLQPPCNVKILTPLGNASYTISKRSGTILIQEGTNNIIFPVSQKCSSYPTVYLTCVNEEFNNYKFYKLEEKNGEVIATYGRIGAAKGELYGERSCKYPLRMFWIKYEEKLAKGYEDKSNIYIDTNNSSPEKSHIENHSNPNNDSAKNAVADALYAKLLRHAKHMIEKTCVSVMITEGMIIESKRLLRLLYETKNIEDFNKVLKELLSVCPRKVWKVEELLASSSDQIPEVIQREEDLVMAMQVVSGNQKKDLSFNAFDRYGISVSIPSEEKRQKILELLAPELRRKVTNIYRIKTSKQEKKFKTYLKERNISEIKSLWHGSRNENWLSIVENSLSLNPNAVITGKMFGNGIYFAPNSLKSWGYTSGGYWTREMSNPTRFMGLYATAYGEPLNVSSPGQYSESKIGHHGCVHAHAGSYLRNDEIIFYNESAMLLTYLVEFTA